MINYVSHGLLGMTQKIVSFVMTPKSFVMIKTVLSRLKKVLSRGLIKRFFMNENNFVMKEKIQFCHGRCGPPYYWACM